MEGLYSLFKTRSRRQLLAASLALFLVLISVAVVFALGYNFTAPGTASTINGAIFEVFNPDEQEVLQTIAGKLSAGQQISQEEQAPRYAGFYKEEIKRITMLGDDKDLDWELTRQGLVIETPDNKPCKHAFVFKIERYHHPKID